MTVHASRFFALLPLLLLGAPALTRAQDAPAPSLTRNASVHDPSIVRAGDTYYVFGSHFAAASSTDLMNWTQIATSPAVGNALVNNPRETFRDALAWANTDTFWAPDAIRLADGRYYYYYCACQGDAPRSALGLAVADSITGPYADAGIMLRSGMWGQASPDGTVYDATRHPNVVDPSVFFDQGGRLWMVYGSYSGGIFILELNPADGRLLPNQGYGKKLIGGNHARIEAPYIIYSPETRYYYLFVSYGGLAADGGYNMRVGRSRAPDGPYLDASGRDLTTVAGAPGTLFDDASIAPHGVKLMGGFQFLPIAGEPSSSTQGYVSPGHNSVYRHPDTGQYFLVFHTRFVGRGEQHEVRVHQLWFNSDGWPVVAPHRYAGERISRTVTAQIAGDYKLINHGKAITATPNRSTVVTLAADGSISGASSGQWQLAHDHDATLTLGGSTYRGVFVRQWNEDQRVWVRAFTAVSSDGVTVWGSKVASAANSAPVIHAPPASQTVAPSTAVTLSVVADAQPAPTYQWRKDGVDLPGATASTYRIASSTAADAGNYTVVVRNSVGSATSTPATLTVASAPPQTEVPNGTGDARIVNLSTRGIVAPGENALIAGFVISGAEPKPLLILSAGQDLAKYGVTGAIGRPRIALYELRSTGNVLLAANSDWSANAATINPLRTALGVRAFEAPTDSAHGDAGLVATLPAGSYSVVVSPDPASANQNGVGLVEIFDGAPTGASRLINISSRGRVEAGERQMIVGVVIAGRGEQRTLLRGVGPGLSAFGVTSYLPDPSQVLRGTVDGASAIIGTNNDWWNSSTRDQLRALEPMLGAFPLLDDSRDSAVLMRLPPGAYTSVLSPADGTAGIAIAEIYDANTR